MNDKSMFSMLMLTVLTTFILAGCGPSASQVYDSHLKGREQTTIGDAFKAAFDNPKWELKQTENKTRFVEFTGKARRNISVGEGVIVPKGNPVKMQFLLKKDEFEINYAEAQLQVTIPILKGMIDESKPVPLQDKGVDQLLDGIYTG